jgi:methyltransferase (TIGR00027 family)
MAVSHPIARTAFYCTLLRAADAASGRPVCGDALAGRFVDDAIRRELEPVLRLRPPAASNVARHRIIDDLVREYLREHPSGRVILPGAGFDTRAFRMTGGQWWEIDDAELLAYKEERLPVAESPNPLTRLPIDWRRESLADRLAPLAGTDRAMVVLEGVAVYLDDAALASAAATVRSTLPGAVLVADLMSPAFARTYARNLRRGLSRLGATFVERRMHPSRIVEGAGYRPRERHSITGRAREAGTLRVPGWLFHTLLRGMRDGYAIWVFEPS